MKRSKPVIVCGDFNVAHKEIDLAHPKANYNKTAGYMQEEIDGMDRFTGGGLADTFRRFILTRLRDTRGGATEQVQDQRTLAGESIIFWSVSHCCHH